MTSSQCSRRRTNLVKPIELLVCHVINMLPSSSINHRTDRQGHVRNRGQRGRDDDKIIKSDLQILPKNPQAEACTGDQYHQRDGHGRGSDHAGPPRGIVGVWRSLNGRREAVTGIQLSIRYAEPSGKSSDDEPVILVVGRLAEECGRGHASC